VSPGFLPILSATGVSFIPYYPQRVKKQFELDQDVPVGPQETTPCIPDLAPFIKSRAFAHWKAKISCVMVPSGHRFGFNSSSINAYWQRLTQSMVEFVNVGRSDKTPISVHRKPQTSNPCLAHSSQSAISYGNSQKLGFAEWDEVRGGWIAYTIHLPERWKNSVNIVEKCLIMPSKRGKGSKRDDPVDLAVEKASKKPAPFPKKTPPKKTKAGKKGKSTTSAPASGKKSTTAPIEKPIESTATPSNAESVGASLFKKKPSKKSVASRPSKGQRKASTSSSSPEQPSAAPTRSSPKKKKLVIPPPLSGAASRTRSKSGFKVSLFSFPFHLSLSLHCSLLCSFILLSAAGTRKSSRSGDTVVDVEVAFVNSLFPFFLDQICVI
jgi:hypothetical protein